MMSFRCGSEAAASIAGHSGRRRAYGGMQAECDHPSAGAGTSRHAQRRWRSDHLRRMSAWSGASLSNCALLVQRKLRSRRDYRAVSNVEFAHAAVGRSFQRGRRSNYGGLRSSHSLPRCIVHIRRWRNHRAFHPRRKPRDLRCKDYRRRSNRHARLVRPGYGVGQSDVVLQFHAGRGDDGLGTVIRLPRHGNDGLRGEFGVSLMRPRGGRAASVQRRQIFRRCVINHVGMRERGQRRGMWPQREKARSRQDHGQRQHVTRARLHEPPPRKWAVDEHIRPKSRGSGLQMLRNWFARLK